MTLLGAEILARIPVNMLDRFISCFGAFAVSYLLSKGVRKIQRKTI
jgi:surface polysaccharide O-acyltransferase-like enzyme